MANEIVIPRFQTHCPPHARAPAAHLVVTRSSDRIAADEDAVVRHHDVIVDRFPDYTAADLKSVTLREAVARRPAMYFGGYAAEDWPLVIAAWTVTDLLDYVATTEPVAMVTLHRDGELSAAVSGARLTWPVTAKPSSAEDLIRRRMWWRQLGSDMTVTVLRTDAPPGSRRTPATNWSGTI